MIQKNISKSLSYSRYYAEAARSKRVSSGGAHLRGLAPGRHSSKETSRCGGEPLATLCRFDRSGKSIPVRESIPDLLHR